MSHYSIGSSTYTHKNKKVTSIVGNAGADRFIQNLDTSKTEPGVVPPAYDSRPDLIANLFMEDPDQLWYLCLLSGKYDVFEDFYTGSRINLPK